MSGTHVMPFGKYRDEPMDVVLDDPTYCLWLVSQKWFEWDFPEEFALVSAEVRLQRHIRQLRADFLRT